MTSFALISLVCALDLGSNSFRRIVGSFEQGRYVQRHIEVKTVGVGDDVARHGGISAAKLEEIEKTLAAFKRACDADGAAPVVAVGTAAFRDAPNSRRVVDIAAKHGIRLEIASARRESELAYLVGSLGREGYAVIDNGSRTIELAARAGGTLKHHVLDLGYRVAFERFFRGATDASSAVQAFQRELRQAIAPAGFMKGQTALSGIEFGDMVSVFFEPGDLEGRTLTVAQLKKALEGVTAMPRDCFAAFLATKDADRALPRLVVAVTLAEAFGYREIVLTERELGTGLIIEGASNRR